MGCERHNLVTCAECAEIQELQAENAKLREIMEAAKWLKKNCDAGFGPTHLDIDNPQELKAYMEGKRPEKSSGDTALRRLTEALAKYEEDGGRK